MQKSNNVRINLRLEIYNNHIELNIDVLIREHNFKVFCRETILQQCTSKVQLLLLTFFIILFLIYAYCVIIDLLDWN